MLRTSTRLFLVCALAGSATARADATDDARAEFIRGTKLAEEAQWSEALAAFEKSGTLKSHPLTTYNIGACERALGRYTRARRSLRLALAGNEASGGTAIKPNVVANGKGYLEEIEGKLAKLDVRVSPTDVLLAVDGRPLEIVGGIAVAGTRTPGPPEAAPGSPFRLEVDPGTHTFTVTRAGLGDTSIPFTFQSGQKGEIELRHEPPKNAVAVVSSPSKPALGAVDGGALHPLPWTVQLAPGSHELTVRVPGQVASKQSLEAKAGITLNVFAPLPLTSQLLVSANVESRYVLDGAFVGTLPLHATGVGGDPMRIDVTKPGYRPWSGTVAVPAGRTAMVEVKLAKEGDRKAGTLFYVGTVLALTFAASAVTTHLLALDARSTFDGLVQAGRRRDDPEALKVANRGEVLVSITNVLWIGAAALGLGTASWLVFGGEVAPSTASIKVF